MLLPTGTYLVNTTLVVAPTNAGAAAGDCAQPATGSRPRTRAGGRSARQLLDSCAREEWLAAPLQFLGA